MCHLYLHLWCKKKKLMWNKDLGMFLGYLEKADTWETQTVNPNEPRWAAGHLFSGNTSLDFAPHNNTLHSQPILPLPSAGVLSARNSDLSQDLSQFFCPGLFPSCAGDWWVPAGHDCWHRWESRPVMTSICHAGLAGLCFFNVFLSISHLFLCVLFFKMAWVEMERRVPLRLDRVKLKAH